MQAERGERSELFVVKAEPKHNRDRVDMRENVTTPFLLRLVQINIH